MSEPTTDRMLTLARRAVSLTGADEAEVIATTHESALTRFARNRIHQNVTETDTRISVRAVLGTQTGTASTNRVDEDGIRACCDAAVSAARSAPADPDFPAPRTRCGCTDGRPDRTDPSALSFTAEERAAAIGSIVSQSAHRGLEAAGAVSASVQTVAVANSLGTARAMSTSSVRATVLSAGDPGGSGWAAFCAAGADTLDPVSLGSRAAEIAARSIQPQDLAPGSYAVVLAPEAVADIVAFLGYAGFSARAVAEGRSFMSEREGERIVSEQVSIADDALSPDSFGLTFDLEGVSKQRVSLIDRGVAAGSVTDSYWAAKTGRPNTGHALPSPNPYGPLPFDLKMAPGDATIDELIASIERGVFVTRFHYTNIEDPVPVTLTGMTRDGTFLIENGSLTQPLKNLRFTQSAIAALDSVTGVGREREFYDVMLGCALVPGVAISEWSFTGQTE